MSNNPQTRMQAFDAMPPLDRDLANEFSVNVVRLYRGLGADDATIRAACERHRLAKQFEQIQPALSRKVNEKAVTRDVLRLMAAPAFAANPDRTFTEAEIRTYQERAKPVVAEIIADHDAYYAEHPLPPKKPKAHAPAKRSWISRLLRR